MPASNQSGLRMVAAAASEREADVTAAMIEAGLGALRREPNVDLYYGQAVDLVEDILRSALAASRSGTSPSAPSRPGPC
jgi:hypothetical protein